MVHACALLLLVVDGQAYRSVAAVCRVVCFSNMGVLPMAVKMGAAPDNPLHRFRIPQSDKIAVPKKADVLLKKRVDAVVFKRETDKINREVWDD